MPAAPPAWNQLHSGPRSARTTPAAAGLPRVSGRTVQVVNRFCAVCSATRTFLSPSLPPRRFSNCPPPAKGRALVAFAEAGAAVSGAAAHHQRHVDAAGHRPAIYRTPPRAKTEADQGLARRPRAPRDRAAAGCLGVPIRTSKSAPHHATERCPPEKRSSGSPVCAISITAALVGVGPRAGSSAARGCSASSAPPTTTPYCWGDDKAGAGRGPAPSRANRA